MIIKAGDSGGVIAIVVSCEYYLCVGEQRDSGAA